MKDNSLVKFDEHGLFEIQDPSLLDVVSGGFSLSASFSPRRSNQTCGTDINEQCGTQTNGGCELQVNNVCGANEQCIYAEPSVAV